jgi:CxxC motif-containing protein
MGCKLIVNIDESNNNILKIEGNKCLRGIDYANDEIKDPKRILTSSVKVNGGDLPLVSVKTDRPIPKKLIKEIMLILKEIEINGPIKRGDIIIKNILNSGANIVATRSIKKKA